MAVRIRLKRVGAKKRPFYRVVVADQRSPRDGRFIENIGKYHPLEDPSLIEIDEERAMHWLRVGAQPSNTVRGLMTKVGIWDRFGAGRPTQGEEVAGDRGVLLTLRVAKDDMGKVIGRGGRTARAIRTVMKAAAVREGIQHTHVEIVD